MKKTFFAGTLKIPPLYLTKPSQQPTVDTIKVISESPNSNVPPDDRIFVFHQKLCIFDTPECFCLNEPKEIGFLHSVFVTPDGETGLIPAVGAAAVTTANVELLVSAKS